MIYKNVKNINWEDISDGDVLVKVSSVAQIDEKNTLTLHSLVNKETNTVYIVSEEFEVSPKDGQ